MNKLKQLTKRLGIEAAVVALIVASIAGIMMLTGGMATKALERKTQAETALAQDNAQLATARSQLERSGEAEKRYVEIQLGRNNLDFTSSTDALKEWARVAKARYRFANNFKLNLPPQKPTDKQELSSLDYDILVREGVTMELEAMSDLHVFSFLEELHKGTPGFIRITALEMEKRSDMTAQTIAQMIGGMAPNLMIAKIKFNWVGVNPKPVAADASAPPTAAMPASPANGMMP